MIYHQLSKVTNAEKERERETDRERDTTPFPRHTHSVSEFESINPLPYSKA